MKEAQQVVAEKTSSLEAEAYKTKRLQVSIFYFNIQSNFVKTSLCALLIYFTVLYELLLCLFTIKICNMNNWLCAKPKNESWKLLSAHEAVKTAIGYLKFVWQHMRKHLKIDLI